MTTAKAQIALGTALLGAFAAVWRWHSPPASKLTPEEIDHYLEIISRLPAPGGKGERFITRLRPWAQADDGKPVYMLNLLRYYPELRRFPGSPQFDGTPEESNAHYEKTITPLWLRNAAYPMAGGPVQGPNLIQAQPGQQNWDTAMLVRYPSRRKFLQLLADPGYARAEPYKLMAVQIDLTPVAGGRVVPDLRWIAGGALLALFLGAGWLTAARK